MFLKLVEPTIEMENKYNDYITEWEKAGDKIVPYASKRSIASSRTIIKNGGILENEVMDNGEKTQRYWIDIQ